LILFAFRCKFIDIICFSVDNRKTNNINKLTAGKQIISINLQQKANDINKLTTGKQIISINLQQENK
jgi:hypothetical protein